MKMYSQIRITPLEEMIPNLEIFRLMSNVSFIPDATVGKYLDYEYFLNRSGRKAASALVMRISDEDNFESELANMIVNRYKPKWEQLFSRYSDMSTKDLLNNINVTQETTHGKVTTRVGTDNTSQVGSETHTLNGRETRTESYDSANPFVTSRAISGSYTDTSNEESVRSGRQETLESFPETRKSSKVTTGGYSDTDTITNTRTGSQKVTDKGDTLTGTYGFNSSNSVPTTRVGPADSSLGTTQETTFGDNGLIDAHSGSVTRSYVGDGLKEEVTESGQKKTSTTFGEDGLTDTTTSGTTRTYQNYKDEVTESGTKSVEISYGSGGKTDELSFNGRATNKSFSDTVTNSGTDTVEESGYRYRRDELLQQYLSLFQNANMIDFLEVVYSDVDEILTLPIFV